MGEPCRREGAQERTWGRSHCLPARPLHVRLRGAHTVWLERECVGAFSDKGAASFDPAPTLSGWSFLRGHRQCRRTGLVPG